jgi:type I restriction enzyme M protein
LVFTKSGQTDEVWFYDVENDGRSLDDKRTLLDGHDGDLKDVREKWAERQKQKRTDRTGKCFVVPAQVIRDNGYDLTVGRYRQAVHEEVHYEPPGKILARLEQLESEIMQGLTGLKGAIG